MDTRIIYNNTDKKIKVGSEIVKLLRECEAFDLSVAFVSDSGIQMLKQTLRELGNNGIRGRLITSTYLNFNAPETFKQLLKFDNLEVRIYPSEDAEGFHPKGYIFKNDDHTSVIIGSSNLTQKALAVNQEWNIYLKADNDHPTIRQVEEEYEEQWDKSSPLTMQWIEEYKKILDDLKSQYQIDIKPVDPPKPYSEITPNKMQKEALESISKLRDEGKDKALLISATGTGKTYLAAFDVKEFKPKKMLFVVHRRSIALKARESFMNIIHDRTMGMFSGDTREMECDYIFATVQTISKKENMELFQPDYFDYIIFDEVHKAGAASYQKLFNYYTPKFLLGMSATPDRSDGFDIYKMFEYNIAYEIRLQEALEYDLLCPFHYYGITDLIIDGKDYESGDFTSTEIEQRYDYITKMIEFYGYSGTNLHGLIFVSRQKEAIEVQKELSQRGYNIVALTGESSEEQRQQAMNDLESNEEGSLDYIVTVDIFNEGIDIPKVNQVVMLRPTESAIIFIQQLGRGLRKDKEKDYVVIIDFIGNYEKNFLIPIALSGDRSYNKDNIRNVLVQESATIPGCSTVEFDEISKKKIFQSIDAANFSTLKLIRESYNNLKMKVGHIPSLMDFDKYGEIDVLRIVDNQGSYTMFLQKYEKEFTIKFSKLQNLYIEYVSKKFLSGKRPNDLVMLKEIISNPDNNHLIKTTKEILFNEYSISMDENAEINLIHNLNNEFYSGSSAKTYKDCIYVQECNDDYTISDQFKELLSDDHFKSVILELVEYGLYRNHRDYSNRHKNTCFQLYSKYTYEDVCRLLNWRKAEVALNIGGYKYDSITKTYPVFINYDKDEDISDTTKYEDHFESQDLLVAISKSNRTIDSDDVQNALHASERGITQELFVRKNKDDKISKEFYYLGRIHATGETKPFVMPNTSSNAVEIKYQLEIPVPDGLYDYILLSDQSKEEISSIKINCVYCQFFSRWAEDGHVVNEKSITLIRRNGSVNYKKYADQALEYEKNFNLSLFDTKKLFEKAAIIIDQPANLVNMVMDADDITPMVYVGKKLINLKYDQRGNDISNLVNEILENYMED